jgi:hypothetical protein
MLINPRNPPHHNPRRHKHNSGMTDHHSTLTALSDMPSNPYSSGNHTQSPHVAHVPKMALHSPKPKDAIYADDQLLEIETL